MRSCIEGTGEPVNIPFMRSARIAALAWILALGCWTDPAPTPAPERSEATASPSPRPTIERPNPGDLVVIDERAILFTTPDILGPSFRIAPEHVSGRGRLARVVSTEAELLELSPLSVDEPEGCAAPFGTEGRFSVRLYVDRPALRPVLTRAKQVSFDDGTTLELAAGVPVIAGGPEGRVRVGGAELLLALGDDEVGQWYRAPDTTPFEGRPIGLAVVGKLRYGDHEFAPEAAPFLRPIAQRERDGEELLSFADPCGRFTMIGASERRGDEHEGETPRSAQCWGWGAAEATPVSWEVGGRAGATLDELELVLVATAEPRDGRVCFAAGSLRLCAETSKLEARGPSSCGE